MPWTMYFLHGKWYIAWQCRLMDQFFEIRLFFEWLTIFYFTLFSGQKIQIIVSKPEKIEIRK